jgi:hypothetical protein
LRREEEAKEAKRRGCVPRKQAALFFGFGSRWRRLNPTPASPVAAAALLEAHAEKNGEEGAREVIRENEENKANEEELFVALLSM